MLGSHPIKNRQETVAFGFNRTYNERTNGTRIGLVIVDKFGHIFNLFISEFLLSK